MTSTITAEDADYEQVPVESFGLAVLRGCGWKEGEGIGMTNKRFILYIRISCTVSLSIISRKRTHK